MAREPSNVRSQILDAAVNLLRQWGVKKLAQPQVARAAGVPQGHLTYYFPKKHDLLAAVLERTVELLDRDVRAAVEAPEPASEGSGPALRPAEAVAGALVKNRERTRMMLGLVIEADADPVLRAALMKGVRTVRQAVAHALNRDVRDPEVDLTLAMYWGLGIMHMLNDSERAAERTDELLLTSKRWIDLVLVPARDRAKP